ncbi:acyl-CoA thioesterase [Thiolapillus sp.]
MRSFKTTFRVPFHELDPAGVLFHAHLFSHAHEAYAGLLAKAGFSLKAFLDAGDYLIPLAHAEADYLQPLQLDDEVCITVKLASIGNSSLGFSYRFQNGEVLCATASTTHVFLDRRSRQPVSVPEALRQKLASAHPTR